MLIVSFGRNKTVRKKNKPGPTGYPPGCCLPPSFGLFLLALGALPPPADGLGAGGCPAHASPRPVTADARLSLSHGNASGLLASGTPGVRETLTLLHVGIQKVQIS